MKNDPLAIGVNALTNASKTPVDETDVIRILTTGDGPGDLVRALFEDCSFETLERIDIVAGVSTAQMPVSALINSGMPPTLGATTGMDNSPISRSILGMPSSRVVTMKASKPCRARQP
jgi:hypothetical protein